MQSVAEGESCRPGVRHEAGLVADPAGAVLSRGSCSHRITFEAFEATITDLARCLKPGGYLVIEHSNFRFSDTAVAAQFQRVWRRPCTTGDRQRTPLFGPDNRLLVLPTCIETVFHFKCWRCRNLQIKPTTKPWRGAQGLDVEEPDPLMRCRAVNQRLCGTPSVEPRPDDGRAGEPGTRQRRGQRSRRVHLRTCATFASRASSSAYRAPTPTA